MTAAGSGLDLHAATLLLIARAEGAAGALNAASHEVENDDDAQLLALRAVQWEREAERYRKALAKPSVALPVDGGTAYEDRWGL